MSRSDDQVALIELDEADPLGLVGRNFGILQPVAAGVLIEVDAGVDRFVEIVDAETRCWLCWKSWHQATERPAA